MREPLYVQALQKTSAMHVSAIDAILRNRPSFDIVDAIATLLRAAGVEAATYFDVQRRVIGINCTDTRPEQLFTELERAAGAKQMSIYPNHASAIYLLTCANDERGLLPVEVRSV